VKKRKMNKTKKSIVAFLLAATILISMVGMVSSDPSLKWDLDSGTPLIMYEPGHTETGSVTIAKDTCEVWRADQSATPAGGVYFIGEQWLGRLTTGESLLLMYTADVGYSDADGNNFVSNGVTGSQTWYDVTYGASNFAISANGFLVPQGKYLAIEVCNTGKDPSFTATTDGSSYVVWPLNEPLYPVPELSTLVLISFGLLALFGYVVYRRRNNKK
jgi:hypothetical protein